MKLNIVIAVVSSLVTLTLSEDIPPCPDCHSNIYLPEYNCSQFWECANGVATLKDCPRDSHFKPDADVCDWMWNFEHKVPCRRWTEDDLVCKAPEPTTKPETADALNTPPCPKHCPYLLHVPDGTCREYYWECYQGKAYRLKCPGGLVFDPEAKVCNSNKSQKERGWNYEDLICRDITSTTTKLPITTTKKGGTCTESPKTTTKSPSTTTKMPSTTTKTPSSISPSPLKCSPGVEFLINPVDCTTYYHCSNGVAILMPCPQGLHWNVEKSYCDWPSIANCKQVS